jgi:uncharacterized protein YjbI with pentapeptide repeats
MAKLQVSALRDQLDRPLGLLPGRRPANFGILLPRGCQGRRIRSDRLGIRRMSVSDTCAVQHSAISRYRVIRVLAFLLTMLTAPLAVCAEDVEQAPPADGKCSVPADDHWKPQEQLVWKRVCSGDEANFNIEPGYGGDLDPKDPAGLPESRVLSSSFLATILLSDKYRPALTRRGVRITGARFTESVDLQNAELSSELWLDRSLFEKGADFSALRSTRRLTLYGSKIIGPLKMNELDLRGDLSIAKAQFTEVQVPFAHVGGYLDLSESTVSEDLNMVGLQVDGYLSMNNAKFSRIDLTSARLSWLLLDGARVAGLLNMGFLQVNNNLVMSQAEFADVMLGLAHVRGHLVLVNSKVTGDLVMLRLRVDGNFMSVKTEFKNANLAMAEVDGTLSLIGATVNGDLDLSNLRVGQDLQLNSISEKFLVASMPEFFRSSFDAIGLKVKDDPTSVLKARFGKVVLSYGRVQGGVSLVDATLSSDLLMDGVQIGGDLTMVGAESQAVDLERAHVAGLLNLRGSNVSGQLDCYASEIGSRFEFSGGKFADSISCSFAKIGELDLAGGIFQDNVDLTGAQIRSELRIGSAGKARTHWADKSTLYLRNATANAIQDLPDAWPTRIDLSGFAYRNLGGRDATKQAPMADRPVSWFVSWLGKQDPYASAPYEQLATALRNSGRPGAADEILYAGKQRERAQAIHLRRAWLTMIDALIGYGYHMERALLWVAGFILAGIAVLRFSGEGPRNQMPFGIVYSFDLLLPIVRLREKHYQIDLEGWPRYYFYMHKVMGYVLASFLITGIAGLTK